MSESCSNKISSVFFVLIKCPASFGATTCNVYGEMISTGSSMPWIMYVQKVFAITKIPGTIWVLSSLPADKRNAEFQWSVLTAAWCPVV